MREAAVKRRGRDWLEVMIYRSRKNVRDCVREAFREKALAESEGKHPML